MAHKIIIFLVLICFTNLSCQEKITPIPNFNPNGKLLFIEDIDGKGGLSSFDFGDIIVFDIETHQKTHLTNDKFFDNHPYWSSDGNKIIFESKRIDTGEDGICDLSDDSRLFIIDISKGEIKQLDYDFEKIFTGEVGSDNQSPAWSPVKNEIAFVTKIDFMERLVLLDLDKNRITSLSKPDEFKLISILRWSHDGERLAFEFKARGGFLNRGIAIIETEPKSIRIITNPKESCMLSGWSSDGSSVLFSYLKPFDKESGFFNYHLETDETRALGFPDLLTEDGQYSSSSETVFFLGYTPKSNSIDLWSYGISEEILTRLTYDGHEKSGLVLFR